MMEIGLRKFVEEFASPVCLVLTYRRTINGKEFEFGVVRENKESGESDPNGKIIAIWVYDEEDSVIHEFRR